MYRKFIARSSAIENRHQTIAADLPLHTDFIREFESVQVKIAAAQRTAAQNAGL